MYWIGLPPYGEDGLGCGNFPISDAMHPPSWNDDLKITESDLACMAEDTRACFKASRTGDVTEDTKAVLVDKLVALGCADVSTRWSKKKLLDLLEKHDEGEEG